MNKLLFSLLFSTTALLAPALLHADEEEFDYSYTVDEPGPVDLVVRMTVKNDSDQKSSFEVSYMESDGVSKPVHFHGVSCWTLEPHQSMAFGAGLDPKKDQAEYDDFSRELQNLAKFKIDDMGTQGCPSEGESNEEEEPLNP